MCQYGETGAGGQTKQMETKRYAVEELCAAFPAKRRHAAALVERFKQIAAIPDGAAFLDVGCGTGGLVAALTCLGYRCQGIEPVEGARACASELAQLLGTSVDIAPGIAENLPFQDEQFDVVIAYAVMEHVADVDRAFSEIYRVLKPGGVFWFYAASSMCPRQGEIRRFPLFGWYPDKIKRRIMEWARVRKPHLVNYTLTPAINWFTPWKAARLLRRSGFTQVYDRWDLRLRTEGDGVRGLILRFICTSRITKILADVCIADCSYAAIK